MKRPTKAELQRWRDPVNFCSEVLCDPETGKPFQLYAQQADFLRRALALGPDGKMQFSELVFSAPKKSGKTATAAMIALYTAAQLAGQRGEIYCLANDLEQSQSRVFSAVAAILEASPLLRNSAKIGRDRIVFKATGTMIAALANDYRGFSGSNPTLTIFDESAYYTSESSRRFWEEGVPSPARKISFRLSVSTAGFEGEPSPLRDLFDRAQEFGTVAPDAPDVRMHENLLCYWSRECRAPWQTDAWQNEMSRTLRPPQFARLIRNEWVTSESTFVELAEWDRCVDPDARPVISDRRLEVWAGLDLGLKHDATALVVVARQNERLRLVDHKIFIPKAGETLDIEATAEAEILELARRFNLREISFDPWQGIYLSQRLQRAGITVAELPQSLPNLTSMANNLLDLIKRRQIILYSDDDLRRAIAKTIAIESSRGWRLGKAKQSDRVDPVIALGMAALAAMKAEPAYGIRIEDFDSGQVLYDSARVRGDDSYFYKPPPQKNRPPGSCSSCGAMMGAVGGHETEDGQRLCSECFFSGRGKPLDSLRA